MIFGSCPASLLPSPAVPLFRKREVVRTNVIAAAIMGSVTSNSNPYHLDCSSESRWHALTWGWKQLPHSWKYVEPPRMPGNQPWHLTFAAGEALLRRLRNWPAGFYNLPLTSGGVGQVESHLNPSAGLRSAGLPTRRARPGEIDPHGWDTVLAPLDQVKQEACSVPGAAGPWERAGMRHQETEPRSAGRAAGGCLALLDPFLLRVAKVPGMADYYLRQGLRVSRRGRSAASPALAGKKPLSARSWHRALGGLWLGLFLTGVVDGWVSPWIAAVRWVHVALRPRAFWAIWKAKLDFSEDPEFGARCRDLSESRPCGKDHLPLGRGGCLIPSLNVQSIKKRFLVLPARACVLPGSREDPGERWKAASAPKELTH
eukprot:bmy_09323T0